MEQIQYSTTSSEYTQAMRSIRTAKNIFWLMVLLSVVIQITVTVLVHLFRIHCHLPEQPASAPAAAGATWQNWASWGTLLQWLLPATKFLGAVGAMLLTLSVLFAVMIALLGRRPGLATMISCFFWSLILLAVLVPWQQVLHTAFASGALFNFTELKTASDAALRAKGSAEIFFLIRFLAYPALAVLLAVVVQAKFAIASRAISGMPAILLAPEKPTPPTP